MSNDYFNHVNNRVSPNTRALDSQINNIADEIALGFDKIPDESEIRGNTVNLATNIGTAQAMVATLSYTPSLVDGFKVRIKSADANTGATTLNLNNLGAIPVRNSDRSELTPGAIATDTINDLYYHQTTAQWVLTSNNSAWGKPAAGGGQNPSEYCPGYTFGFINAMVWEIVGFNVTNLFYVGRRLKFIDGANEYYGTIIASNYTTSTVITMSMEGGDDLTNTIGEVCLTTGTAGWSPIAGDPFDGRSINDICVGDIGATTWLFAVGDAGKCGVSSNGGDNWTMLTTGTPQDLSSCVYDSVNEAFWAGGEGGVLITTSNASSITLDFTSIPALAGSTTYDIYGIAYNSSEDAVILIFDSGANSCHTAASIDQGTTWTRYAALSNSGILKRGFKSIVSSIQTGIRIYIGYANNTIFRWVDGYADTGVTFGVFMQEAPHAIGLFVASDLGVLLSGGVTGKIDGYTGWSGDDSVTFSQKVNSFAYSDLHKRVVLVGENQQMGYWDEVDKDVHNSWTIIANGFNPLASIESVVWDYTNAVFIAVADNGQICRSTNGTN